MIISRRKGEKVSKYLMTETQFFFVAFTIEVLRNISGIFYPIISPSTVLFFHLAFVIISFWIITYYLSRIIKLFNSMKITIPKYLRIVDLILGKEKYLLLFLILTNITNFIGLILVFIFNDERELIFLRMILLCIGVIITGIPLIYFCFGTFKYLKLWEKYILSQKSILFKTTPKAADIILINLENLKNILIILNIAIIIYALWQGINGYFYPIIAKSTTLTYFVLIVMDLVIPLLLFFASLPTAIHVYKIGSYHSKSSNDIIEDIERNIAKTMGTFVDNEGLEIVGVKPFDLRPIRTGTQVDQMDR